MNAEEERFDMDAALKFDVFKKEKLGGQAYCILEALREADHVAKLVRHYVVMLVLDKNLLRKGIDHVESLAFANIRLGYQPLKPF
jgi:hypothetical protein